MSLGYRMHAKTTTRFHDPIPPLSLATFPCLLLPAHLIICSRHLLCLLLLHILLTLFLFVLSLIFQSNWRFVLRTRTCNETLGISAAYQGVATHTYVSTHDAAVRVRGMSASEQVGGQRSIVQPASNDIYL